MRCRAAAPRPPRRRLPLEPVDPVDPRGFRHLLPGHPDHPRGAARPARTASRRWPARPAAPRPRGADTAGPRRPHAGPPPDRTSRAPLSRTPRASQAGRDPRGWASAPRSRPGAARPPCPAGAPWPGPAGCRRTPATASSRSPRPARPAPRTSSAVASCTTRSTCRRATGSCSGTRTRSAVMVRSKENRASAASSSWGRPWRSAAANSASSTSVTLRASCTWWPAPRSTRAARSVHTNVLAWPRCVTAYGVMPQTYTRTGPTGSTGSPPSRPAARQRDPPGRLSSF